MDTQDLAILKAFANINANVLINNYAAENVVFGRIKTGEKIPLNKYFEDLRLIKYSRYIDAGCLDGNLIENGCIKEYDFDGLCFELFKDKTDLLFSGVPVDKSFDADERDIYRYKYGLYEYLKKLFPAFLQIMKTETSPEPFSAVPDLLDENEKSSYYKNLSKFILAIKFKKIRQGGRIDRYINKLPFVSPIVRRLFTIRKEHYILTNSDIDSYDYKFALLSCFTFFNENNAKLFESKIMRFQEHL